MNEPVLVEFQTGYTSFPEAQYRQLLELLYLVPSSGAA